MTWVHLHLLLNHVPVIGSVGGLLLLGYAAVRPSAEVLRLTLGMFVALAGIGVLVFLTGEPTEELVERLPGISEAFLERHEDAALVATALLGVYGAIALGALVLYRGARAIPRAAVWLLLALALIPTSAMAWTANLGGQIRHSEIRAETGSSLAPIPDRESPAKVEGP